MDLFRQWALSLVVSAAAVTIVTIITPRGATDKTVKAVASIFVISVIFTPFSDISINFPSVESNAEYSGKINGDLSEFAVDSCCEAVENALVETAEKLDVSVKEICINADINTDGCIIIQDVSVKISSAYAHNLNNISKAFGDAAGVSVSVIAE